MRSDAHGLPITSETDAAAPAYDAAVLSLLRFRTDIRERMEALLAAEPGFALAHCLQGYLTMMTYNAAALPSAARAHQRADAAARNVTVRERAHVAALGRWVAGDVAGATRVWEQILAEHPRDILAFRLAHFAHFWRGEPAAMLDSVSRVLPQWNEALPAYGTRAGLLLLRP